MTRAAKWMMSAAMAGILMAGAAHAQDMGDSDTRVRPATVPQTTKGAEAAIAAEKQQSGAAAPSGDRSDASLVTLTVHEAWIASGRNEDRFFDIVEKLAAMSAGKRGITLPQTEEAGTRMGAWIKKEGRSDPDQLLYAVVDGAVRHVGMKQAAAGK